VNDVPEVAEPTALDLVGVGCPFVLAEIVRAFEKRPSGGLNVLCDCREAVRETVPAFCARHGYELKAEDVGDGVHRLLITRR
jgi:TusA-related sulfurtransferase